MMERELNILIIEDDEKVCRCFKNYAETMDKLSIVECTDDAYKGIELLQEYFPDVIILDLELDKGKGNGIDFLNNLDKLELPYKPFVVVTTNNSSEMTKGIVGTMGVDFYFSKHQKDYSEKGVLQFLETMKTRIQDMIKREDKDYELTESVKHREKRIRAFIVSELEKVGISPKAVGYKYLISAISLLVDGEERSLPIVIGEMYGKSSPSVERAMQHAIDRAWKVNDPDELFKYYTARVSTGRGAPTVTEFVYYYANKIEQGMGD